MICLILAAGTGTRLRPRGDVKPLVPILEVPLLERVMHAALAGGADRFVLVTGYEGPRVRQFADSVARRAGTPLVHVVNERWKEPNGVSVLSARAALDEPFFLLMSDHLFDPAISSELAAAPPALGEIVLAVDYDLSNPLVDLDDVTRVQVEEGFIRGIGKGIATYNAFDTGIFYATPGLFDAIETSIATGDASLSGGVRTLAAAGRARAFDAGARFWIDVDDPAAVARAERMLRSTPSEASSPGSA